MKSLVTHIILIASSFFVSCEEKMGARSETQCRQARFISKYCNGTSEPLYLVEFLSPTSLTKNYSGDDANPRYVAAMLDLPESVQVRDTTFYMQIHHDPFRESEVTIGLCTANFGPASILVCEGISPSCP
jgi:NADH:ubiquinone oxidoreductase subunit E